MRNVIFLLSLSLAASGPAQASHDYRPGNQWPGSVAAERFHDSAVHYHQELKYTGAPRHAVQQSRTLARQARDLKRMVNRGADGRSLHHQYQRMSNTLATLQHGPGSRHGGYHDRGGHRAGSRSLGQLNPAFERLGSAIYNGRGYRPHASNRGWEHGNAHGRKH